MSIRTLYAKAVRATQAHRDTAVLVIEANADDHTELFELVLDNRVLLGTLRDALTLILEDPPNA